MDTATVIKAPAQNREIRKLSILCSSQSHRYCSKDRNSYCGCDCHYELQTVKARDIYDFACELWTISRALKALDDATRTEVYYDIISKAHGVVDFQGLVPVTYLERVKPTLERDYYSRGETEKDFGLKGSN